MWHDLMQSGGYSAAIVAFVRDYEPATFAEVVENCFPDGFQTTGEYTLKICETLANASTTRASVRIARPRNARVLVIR